MKVVTVVLVVTVATIASACSASHTNAHAATTAIPPVTTPDSVVAQPKTVKCSARAPNSVPSHQVVGTVSRFVPGQPVRLLICRYHGFNQPQPVGSLARSALVPAGPFVRPLNEAPRVPNAAIYNCPIDYGEKVLLIFTYQGDSRLVSSFDLGGCRFAQNGDLTIAPPESVITRIESLVGRDTEHP